MERLRAGDEAAFMDLVDRYGPLMLRIALMHVSSRAVAEEVVQDAWLGVLRGLDRFEGRSSLKTWIARIVANQGAHARASASVAACRCRRWRRTTRSRPSTPCASARSTTRATPAAGRLPPEPLPEERLLADETLAHVREAISRLPPRQQEVILLRDVEGWEPEEVGDALGPHARQPARAAAPRAIEGAQRARGLPGGVAA